MVDVAPFHSQPIHNNPKINNDVSAVDNNEKRPMKSEFNRRQSFINWPHAFLSPQELAKEGFFYTQKQDIVKCAFCNLELGKWEPADIPAQDHRNWSCKCPLVCNLPCGNIQMSENDSNGLGNGAQSIDTCGKYGIHVRQNSGPENGIQNSCDITQYAIKPTISYHQFATFEARLRTFEDWPVSIHQKPAQLADAGFFYSGKSDQTLCFSCGGGLKAWEAEDEPWEQHATWFPTCPYLRLHKSSEFIAAAQNKNDDGKLKNNGSVPNASASSTPVKPAVTTPAVTATSETVNKVETISTSNKKAEDAVASASSDEKTKENPVNMCKICYMNEIGVVFLPCGHMIACVNCAPALTQCAVCRRDLEATVRAFLS